DGVLAAGERPARLAERAAGPAQEQPFAPDDDGPPPHPPRRDAREVVRPRAAPAPHEEQEAEDRDADPRVVADHGDDVDGGVDQHDCAPLDRLRERTSTGRGWSMPARSPLRTVARIFRSPGPAASPAATRAAVTTSSRSTPAPTSWPSLNAARFSRSFRCPGGASATSRASRSTA